MSSEETKALMEDVRAVHRGDKNGAECGFPLGLIARIKQLSDKDLELLEEMYVTVVEAPQFRHKILGLTLAASVVGKLKPEMVKSALSERMMVYATAGTKPDIELDGARQFYKRGQKHFQTEDYEKAKSYFARAVEIAPHYREGWFALAGTCELLGLAEQASAAWKRAQELL